MNSAKDRHIYELTENISTMMGELIESRTQGIRAKLSELIVKNLRHIYRKENLISKVQVAEDFSFILYQDQSYTAEELLRLWDNFGREEFCNNLGSEGVEMLYGYLGVSDINEVYYSLRSWGDKAYVFDLQKRIRLSMLSRGERQIFILSLYWAIVQVSGRKIPFIIDTPYARIDADHRGEISASFFPNISEQVIILSTDEEVTGEQYRILKPHIAREYLLKNDHGDNRSTISDGYFFS